MCIFSSSIPNKQHHVAFVFDYFKSVPVLHLSLVDFYYIFFIIYFSIGLGECAILTNNLISNSCISFAQEEQLLPPDIEDYIINSRKHSEFFLNEIADPREKSVLIVGSGWGTEILWCIEKGAKSVVGVDPAPRSMKPLNNILSDRYLIQRYTVHQALTEDIAAAGMKFDLVLSNNAFEHISDIHSCLGACKSVLKNEESRVAIFTDPLFYSSAGSHLPIEPWQHLWDSEEMFRNKVDDWLWTEYKYLNKMTVTDFLNAIRVNNFSVLKMSTVKDRNLGLLQMYKSKIVNNIRVSDMDLSIEGISIELSAIF
jgi:hypothetical protein